MAAEMNIILSCSY